jgi:hypothetical protein
MIALDSLEWNSIQCTRGPASQVPALLREIYANPYVCEDGTALNEVWFDLWDLLCHQGTISSASFAAVPHLIEAGLSASPGILHWELIELPLQIERSRMNGNHFKGTKAAEEIDPGYFESLGKLSDLCKLTGDWGRSKTMSEVVASARRLLSKRRGKFLPKQRTDLGPLFHEQTAQ